MSRLPMTQPPNLPCPCHSGVKYKRCCRPFHRGALAPTPEALMRSRYCAFAIGLADYVMDTTDPEGSSFNADRAAWGRSIEEFSRSTEFADLQVISAEATGVHGAVKFKAGLIQGGKDVSFTEASRFVKAGGAWLYHSGVLT